MRNEKVNIVIIFLLAAFALLWYAMPDKGYMKPFLFSDKEIDAQSWVWIGCFYGSMAIFASTLWVGASDNSVSFFRAAFILQACLFVEYLANYNQSWGHLTIFGLRIPVHIATLRLPILLFYAIRTFIKWKT